MTRNVDVDVLFFCLFGILIRWLLVLLFGEPDGSEASKKRKKHQKNVKETSKTVRDHPNRVTA